MKCFHLENNMQVKCWSDSFSSLWLMSIFFFVKYIIKSQLLCVYVYKRACMFYQSHIVFREML